MLFQNYIYNHPGIMESYKEEIDSTALMIRYFSGLFGRYPYWQEKYGHCLVPLGGGMERIADIVKQHINNRESELK